MLRNVDDVKTVNGMGGKIYDHMVELYKLKIVGKWLKKACGK